MRRRTIVGIVLVQRGFKMAGAESDPFGRWEGEVLRLRAAQTLPPETPPNVTPTGSTEDLPTWLGAAERLDSSTATAGATPSPYRWHPADLMVRTWDPYQLRIHR